jgi:ribosomal protein S4
MPHITRLLYHMAHCVYTPHIEDTWPRDITWTPDAVEFFASMDTWYGQFSRRGGEARGSLYNRMYTHMRVLSTMYGGLTYTELHHMAQQAHQCHGVWSSNFIKLLERRLDVCLWRALWATSPTHARDMVRRGHITVNGHVCTQSSYSVQPGDVIAICSQRRAQYQHHLVDTWSTTTSPMTPSVPYTPQQHAPSQVSSVDIMAYCTVHGTCTPVHTSPNGCLARLDVHHTPLHHTPQVGDIDAVAHAYLAAMLDDATMARVVWTHVQSMDHTYAQPMANAHAMPHLEVDYSTMSMVYLYAPQRVVWTAIIDMDVLYQYLVL